MEQNDWKLLMGDLVKNAWEVGYQTGVEEEKRRGVKPNSPVDVLETAEEVFENGGYNVVRTSEHTNPKGFYIDVVMGDVNEDRFTEGASARVSKEVVQQLLKHGIVIAGTRWGDGTIADGRVWVNQLNVENGEYTIDS